MPNLLKIGFTTRTLDDRVGELSGTGVPVTFEVEYFAEVDQAFDLERAIHQKLKNKRFGKEFFRCDMRTAVKAAKETIIENNLTVFLQGGIGNDVFLTQSEVESIRQAEEERRRKHEAERQRQLAEARLGEQREQRIAEAENELFAIGPVVDDIIGDKYNAIDNYKAVRFVAAFVALVTIVGMPIADKVQPTFDEMSKKVARQLSDADLVKIRQLIVVLEKLNKYDAFGTVGVKYYRAKQSVWIFNVGSGRFSISSILATILEERHCRAELPNWVCI